MAAIFEGEVDGPFYKDIRRDNASEFTVWQRGGGPDGAVPVLVVLTDGSTDDARRRIEEALAAD